METRLDKRKVGVTPYWRAIENIRFAMYVGKPAVMPLTLGVKVSQ